MQKVRQLKPTELAGKAGFVVRLLMEPDWRVRKAAAETLAQLEPEPAALARHADALVKALEDPDWRVRKAVVETMSKLKPATLAMHVAALVTMLEDPNLFVRSSSVTTLATLKSKPGVLAQHRLAIEVATQPSKIEAASDTVQETAAHLFA